jgi:hypothetical protein
MFWEKISQPLTNKNSLRFTNKLCKKFQVLATFTGDIPAMKLPNKNNPVIAQFCAAGKLINEWRDTLSYGAYAGYVAYHLAHEGGDKLIGSISLVDPIMYREFIRGYLWRYLPERAYVGGFLNSPNRKLCSVSANAFSCMLGIANEFILQHPYTHHIAALVGMTVCTLFAGSPSEVYKSYRDVMWDYPRKKGDGGTTQTQKLLDGIKDVARQIVGTRAPVPDPTPARVRLPEPAMFKAML